MKKIKKVYFTRRANRDLNQLVNNIEENQSPKIAKEFLNDFERVLDRVQEHPEMFEVSQKIKGTRRGLFHKYGAFLYRVFKQSIRVITLFDTRKKP